MLSCIKCSALKVVSLDSLSLKNVYLDTKIRDIAKCEQKIVAILKIQDGHHRVFRNHVNITFQVQ